MVNRELFYTLFRKKFGRFTTKQFQGIEATFNEWDLWVENKWTDNDLRKLAYILATDYHEGNKTFQPIKEIGSNQYFIKRYWTNQKLAKELGNKSAQDAINFCGKGKPMITGRGNYTKMSKILGHDLVRNPDLMLTMDIATEVMFEGMMSGKSFKGDFTGLQLVNFFNKTKNDPLNARRIINGTDKAKLIETYHYDFLDCLTNRDNRNYNQLLYAA